MSESAIQRLERVNDVGLTSFIDWLVKTKVGGESISNGIWTAIARHIRTVLYKGDSEAYTKYCTSYSWSVTATGDVNDPDLKIIFKCREMDSTIVFPNPFDGQLVISKKHYVRSIPIETIIAMDNAANPQYVITAEYTK